MNKLEFTIKLLSDTLPNSGYDTSANLDADIVTDEFGLPYIPAKRIKGLLLESAIELSEALGDPDKLKGKIQQLFGEIGDADSRSLIITDANLKGFDNLREWLQWIKSLPVHKNNKSESEPQNPNTLNPLIKTIFHMENITKQFTTTRRQTALKDGVAEEHALRTMRIIKKDLEFIGTIEPTGEALDDLQIALLAVAMHNIRNLGYNRNRGFGRVEVHLRQDSTPIDLQKAMQALTGRA